jgi:hypothetical protein
MSVVCVSECVFCVCVFISGGECVLCISPTSERKLNGGVCVCFCMWVLAFRQSLDKSPSLCQLADVTTLTAADN